MLDIFRTWNEDPQSGLNDLSRDPVSPEFLSYIENIVYHLSPSDTEVNYLIQE